MFLIILDMIMLLNINTPFQGIWKSSMTSCIVQSGTTFGKLPYYVIVHGAQTLGWEPMAVPLGGLLLIAAPLPPLALQGEAGSMTGTGPPGFHTSGSKS